jgi:pseudouridine synthase
MAVVARVVLTAAAMFRNAQYAPRGASKYNPTKVRGLVHASAELPEYGSARLDRLLAHATGLSRKEVSVALRKGRVVVDGAAAKDGAKHVPLGGQVVVLLDGEPLEIRPPPLLVAYHKVRAAQARSRPRRSARPRPARRNARAPSSSPRRARGRHVCIFHPNLLRPFSQPLGVHSTMSDERGRADLSSALALPPLWASALHPVGRLDADTSGLLLFCSVRYLRARLVASPTAAWPSLIPLALIPLAAPIPPDLILLAQIPRDLSLSPSARIPRPHARALAPQDGMLTQRLLHPRHGTRKEYVALVSGDAAALDDGGAVLRGTLAAGVATAEGVHVADLIEVRPLRGADADAAAAATTAAFAAAGLRRDEAAGRPVAELVVAVTEGKHRMVRRMLANAGHPVEALHRVRFGAIELDPSALPPGACAPVEGAALAWAEELREAAPGSARAVTPGSDSEGPQVEA